MKIYFLSFIFFLSFAYVEAQITLEHEYNTAVELNSPENNYYFSIDYLNNICKVYNLDHSLKKEISIQVPNGWYLNDISYVSNNIFNLNDDIELLAVYYRYIVDSDTSGHYEYYTQVIDENGNILLDVIKGSYSYIYEDANDNLKLMIYIYDFSDYLFISKTNIYSLPGEFPSAEKEYNIFQKFAYPNPATKKINIPYDLNSRDGAAMIILSDINGTIIKKAGINKLKGEKTFSTEHLPAGEYLYYIEQNGRIIAARKFIKK